LYIVGSGMVTSLGSNTVTTCAAMRAKLANFIEVPYTDIRGEAIVGAPVSCVTSSEKGHQRLVDLALPAFLECLAHLPAGEISNTPIVTAVSDASRQHESQIQRDFLAALQARVSVPFSPESLVFREGAMGGVSAIKLAETILAERKSRWCIVGGVDTFLDQSQLRLLERRGRLKRPSQPDGLIPGEAACFILLDSEPDRAGVCASVIGAASVVSVQDGSVPRATDIVSAFRGAIRNAGIRSSDISTTITDMTGERDMGVDHALAITRTFTEPQPGLNYWHSAMSLGSVGAASIPCALAWAEQSALRGYAQGAHTMCSSISEPGGKGAIIVRFQSDNGGDIG
jgi:3-oxoacyl-[acyl-carrier-protein] synthase-1